MKIVDIDIDKVGVDAKLLDSIYVVKREMLDESSVRIYPIGTCQIDYIMKNKNLLKCFKIED